MSHKSTGPVYRCTRCDRCEKVKQDCIWVRPATATPDVPDDEWCLCGECVRRCQAKGVPIVNIDTDFPEVAV